MTQKFTAEEVRACLAEFSADVAFPREEIDIEKVRTMLTAYADTLSKPADSGRVTSYMMEKLADAAAALDKLGRRNQCVHLMDLHAALAAQGQGDAVAEVYEGAFDTHYIACADPNKLPVGTKLYTAQPASPAGVPDGVIVRVSGYLPKQRAVEVQFDGPLPAWVQEPGATVLIAATPSAPEGDGGGE